ncbi:MAG: hypothetical protein JSW08_02805 [archaeon]|nr:MAG: hypothetical protein JSW08_02805 [archaeon]
MNKVTRVLWSLVLNRERLLEKFLYDKGVEDGVVEILMLGAIKDPHNPTGPRRALTKAEIPRAIKLYHFMGDRYNLSRTHANMRSVASIIVNHPQILGEPLDELEPRINRIISGEHPDLGSHLAKGKPEEALKYIAQTLDGTWKNPYRNQ